MKGWNEYFNNKLNEDQQEETQNEIYASELGLNGCKIEGASIIENGIKLDIRDSSSLLGWCNITVKNGKLNIDTEFVDENI